MESTDETAAPTTPQQQPKKPRAKVSVAHKCLLGGNDLFVDPKFVDRCNGPDDLKVEGQFVKCPNEKTNGSCFKVDWLVNLPNTVDTGCLRHWLHKDTVSLLRSLCKRPLQSTRHCTVCNQTSRKEKSTQRRHCGW